MKFAVIDVDLPSEDCPRDVLLIYNGASTAGEAEKRLCGHWENWKWITKDHEAVLQLVSDASDTYQGFYLDFQPIRKVLLPGTFPYIRAIIVTGYYQFWLQSHTWNAEIMYLTWRVSLYKQTSARMASHQYWSYRKACQLFGSSGVKRI